MLIPEAVEPPFHLPNRACLLRSVVCMLNEGQNLQSFLTFLHPDAWDVKLCPCGGHKKETTNIKPFYGPLLWARTPAKNVALYKVTSMSWPLGTRITGPVSQVTE